MKKLIGSIMLVASFFVTTANASLIDWTNMSDSSFEFRAGVNYISDTEILPQIPIAFFNPTGGLLTAFERTASYQTNTFDPFMSTNWVLGIIYNFAEPDPRELVGLQLVSTLTVDSVTDTITKMSGVSLLSDADGSHEFNIFANIEEINDGVNPLYYVLSGLLSSAKQEAPEPVKQVSGPSAFALFGLGLFALYRTKRS